MPAFAPGRQRAGLCHILGIGDARCVVQDVEESEAEANFRKERAGGNYGGGTKELQLMNFKKRQESDARRNGLFETGLQKFNKKDIQGVRTSHSGVGRDSILWNLLQHSCSQTEIKSQKRP